MLAISQNTIAKQQGYNHCIAHHKPFLTKQAVKKHVVWGKDNADRDWSKVVWTDEAKIEMGEQPGPCRVTQMVGEEFLPECIQPTFQSGRQSIIVWGCISHNRKGPLIQLCLQPATINENGKKMGGGLDGPKYIEQVLKGPLKEFLDAVKEDEGSGVLVMEDGAPPHCSKLAKQA